MHRKTSTKRKPISQRLRARALAIINSDKYDGDTRGSIAFQLRTNYDDLADMVRDAEKGVTICDTLMVAADQRKAARQIIALFELPGVPDFLTDSLMDALQRASAIEDIYLWRPKGDAEEFDPAAVAKLLAFTQALSFKPRSPAQRVVEALDELLHNPALPDDLFESLAEFVVTALNRKFGKDGEELLHTPPMLTALVDSFPEDERMGARLAARAAARAKEAQS